MPRTVHVFDHPLIQLKLTLMRRKETSTTSFRRLLNEIGSLMAYEVTREMPTHALEIETPMERMTGRVIEEGAVREVFARPQTEMTRRLIDSARLFGPATEEKGGDHV